VVNGTSLEALIPHLASLESQGPADGIALDTAVRNKLTEKYHVFLSDELLSIDFASSRLDPEGSWQALVRICGQLRVH